MSPIQAGEIINKYGKILSRIDDKHLFRPSAELPMSSCMIKYAFYTYIDELVKMNRMNTPTIESLVVAYGHLAYFVNPEQAETMNKITSVDYHGNDQNTLKLIAENKEMIKLFRLRKDLMIQEIQDYIQDCLNIR